MKRANICMARVASCLGFSTGANRLIVKYSLVVIVLSGMCSAAQAQTKGPVGDLDWYNVKTFSGTPEISEEFVNKYAKTAVALFHEESWDTAFCSGILIGPQLVMTAEHCVDECSVHSMFPNFVGLFYELPEDCSEKDIPDCPQDPDADFDPNDLGIMYFAVEDLYWESEADLPYYNPDIDRYYDFTILLIEDDILEVTSDWEDFPKPRIANLTPGESPIAVFHHPFAFGASQG